MLVLSYRNDVVGIVTRKDLALLHFDKKDGLKLKYWVYPSTAVQKGKKSRNRENAELSDGQNSDTQMA